MKAIVEIITEKIDCHQREQYNDPILPEESCNIVGHTKLSCGFRGLIEACLVAIETLYPVLKTHSWKCRRYYPYHVLLIRSTN
jgi:hypothetical protein